MTKAESLNESLKRCDRKGMNICQLRILLTLSSARKPLSVSELVESISYYRQTIVRALESFINDEVTIDRQPRPLRTFVCISEEGEQALSYILEES